MVGKIMKKISDLWKKAPVFSNPWENGFQSLFSSLCGEPVESGGKRECIPGINHA